MKIGQVLALLAACFAVGCGAKNRVAEPQRQPAPAIGRVHTFERTVSLRYLIYLPTGYDDSEARWPVVLFLHGAGERGDDINRVKIHGPPKRIEQGASFPFILVAPQCPADRWWSVDALDGLLDQIVKDHRVDEDRIYVTGLSMGGFGTWELAMTFPDRFAAIAPVCGGGNDVPIRIARLKKLPIWVFHGAKDQVVPLSQSQKMVDALKAVDGNVRFTIYPDAGHDAWSETYDNPEFYDWLMSQRRSER